MTQRVFEPIDVFSEEEEVEVHAQSLRILSEIGLKFHSEETWPILEQNGCRVDRETGMVRFPPEVVEHFLALAPSEFEMIARNPANSLQVGGSNLYFGSSSGAPNVTDLDNGRRVGTRHDFQQLVRLNHMLPTVSFHTGYPVEPTDTPVNTRHLLTAFDYSTLTDKIARVYGFGRQVVDDTLEMLMIAQGIDRATLQKAPRIQTLFSLNTPLVVDAPLSEGAMEMARNGQVVVVSSIGLAGAMSPVSYSGSIILCNAEAIGAIAFLQMVAPGAPCVYGAIFNPVDMKSGAPAVGAPEMVTGSLGLGQMARRYGLPQRVPVGATSNAPDAQAAYETMFAIWAAHLSGGHLGFHAHGWLEGGLVTSFEKTVLDSEMIGMMGAVKGKVDLSDADEAFEAIRRAGPGGHFLDSPHTMSRYKTAFHRPLISDWRPYEFWSADGAPDSARHANAKWKELLDRYEEPPMDVGTRDALEDFVARRSREIAALD